MVLKQCFRLKGSQRLAKARDARNAQATERQYGKHFRRGSGHKAVSRPGGIGESPGACIRSDGEKVDKSASVVWRNAGGKVGQSAGRAPCRMHNFLICD